MDLWVVYFASACENGMARACAVHAMMRTVMLHRACLTPLSESSLAFGMMMPFVTRERSSFLTMIATSLQDNNNSVMCEYHVDQFQEMKIAIPKLTTSSSLHLFCSSKTRTDSRNCFS